MIFKISLFTLFDILAFSTSVLLGLLFLTKQFSNKKANVYLGAFLISLALEIITPIIEALNEINNITLIFPFHSNLLTIPFLFFYIRTTINRKMNNSWYLIFLPGLIINLINLNNFYLYQGIEYIFNISLLLYLYKIIIVNKKELLTFFSDLSNRTIRWILTIIYIFLVFHLLWITEDILSDKLSPEIFEYFPLASSILTFFLIYWIGFNGFTQKEIILPAFLVTNYEFKKSKTTESDEENAQDIMQFESLSSEIKNQKLYLNHKLNLRTLADAIDLNDKQVSQLINKYSGSNYYTFINSFRIQEFKKQVTSKEMTNLSIWGIAQNSGFSSKSTFYKIFKDQEGITPKEFYKNNKKKSY